MCHGVISVGILVSAMIPLHVQLSAHARPDTDPNGHSIGGEHIDVHFDTLGQPCSRQLHG